MRFVYQSGETHYLLRWVPQSTMTRNCCQVRELRTSLSTKAQIRCGSRKSVRAAVAHAVTSYNPQVQLVVSLNKGTQFRCLDPMILFMGTPKKVPANFGQPPTIRCRSPSEVPTRGHVIRLLLGGGSTQSIPYIMLWIMDSSMV